jgi:hypothetical protein
MSSEMSNKIVIIDGDRWISMQELLQEIRIEIEKISKNACPLDKKVYTVKEVCRIFKIGIATFNRLANNGKLQIFKLSGKRYVKAEVIDNILKNGDF